MSSYWFKVTIKSTEEKSVVIFNRLIFLKKESNIKERNCYFPIFIEF